MFVSSTFQPLQLITRAYKKKQQIKQIKKPYCVEIIIVLYLQDASDSLYIPVLFSFCSVILFSLLQAAARAR